MSFDVANVVSSQCPGQNASLSVPVTIGDSEG